MSENLISVKAEEELSRRWRRESEQYVRAINAFVDRGTTLGWDKVDSSQQPKDTREPMAEAVLAAVRRANAEGRAGETHERFPPAYEPFYKMLEANGQSLPTALLLDDGRIVARIGPEYQPGRVVLIDDLTLTPLPESVLDVGRSPNREYFAVARRTGVTIHRGWDGPEFAHLEWPTGDEGMSKKDEVELINGVPIITELIPFDDGERAILAGPDGIFVLTSHKSIRLFPTKAELREHFKWLGEEHPGDPLKVNLSMEHAAISPDGRWIAAGHQSSSHFVFDATSYKVVGEIGHASEYPHYAVFSTDSSMVAFNSCHFYNGKTIGIPLRLLPGLKTEPYEPDRRLIALESGSRVYAAAAKGDEIVVGDASGYLRAFDLKGTFRWQHFIGSSVGDIDLTRDARRMVVTTYAGFLCILDLDTGKPDPFSIGTATHREVRRWVFWKNEPNPLVW
jgi:hypothetical protein